MMAEPAPEYSKLVRMTAETKAPLRQARIFFLYPSVIAGASIGAYVSLTRAAAGLSGMRTDINPLSDGGNFVVNVAVVAAVVFFGRRDLKAKDEALAEIARELGESPVPQVLHDANSPREAHSCSTDTGASRAGAACGRRGSR